MKLHPEARALVDRLMEGAKYEPGDHGEDFRVTEQLLADCIGDRVMSPRFAFWLCRNCHRKRCTREIAEFTTCLCGSIEIGVYAGDITTKEMAEMVKSCIEREKAQSSIMLPH